MAEAKQTEAWVIWPGELTWHALSNWKGLHPPDNLEGLGFSRAPQTWCAKFVPTEQMADSHSGLMFASNVQRSRKTPPEKDQCLACRGEMARARMRSRSS